MKIQFFITRSIVLLVLLFISCSDDVNELPLEDTQHVKTLRNNFPDIYNQIELSTYQTYSINIPNKGIVSVEAYEIQNDETLQSYYIDIDGRKLVTSITDHAIIQKDLKTNQQFIVPRVYDTDSKRLMPDFEKVQSGFISKINSVEDSGIDICETICWTGYVGCMIGCGVTGITIATQGTIFPDIYDVIAVGVFTACVLACEISVDLCLEGC
ncbi:hypothetical protein [Dokdonia sp.]|uniref:hypothetical protein n=1 Tax=Dokdonia sp. TaxID=2024995 RepID=UPI0032646598